MSDPIGKAYKPWLIASLTVLVLSLVLLAGDVTAAFINFDTKAMPIWVTVVGVLAALGIALGFAGFLGIMLVSGWASWKEGRRVQVLPPERPVEAAKE
ncbi:hypothetical protein SAMN05421770_106167 [Granulicella rosea]|uniref:Uncharacterized protein n=1 Tax=Granulicella rosea TaxID=474952 RepID=A0A239L6Y5_9BACT|nr:hypothetical protein [Granulicella rosea]SNT26386.1 hypothetical protein SAMN05421770_106167 [Granulicella rosea]